MRVKEKRRNFADRSRPRIAKIYQHLRANFSARSRSDFF
jgi:hypothetical protein